MAASVCLRILLDLSDEKLAKLDALGPLVTKVTSAFLETCWSWPDRYTILTPFSFLLVEPGATEVNVERLERLASELQVKLFGQSAAGDVILLLLDGSELDTSRFVQMDHASLKRATQEPLGPTPFAGRLMKISTAADAPKGLHWRKLELEKPQAIPTIAAVTVDEPVVVFHGLYATLEQQFIGSAVAATPAQSATAYSLVDGADHLPADHAQAFDLEGMAVATRLLGAAGPIDGLLVLPVSFSSLMRRSTRELYAQGFGRLPADHRRSLGAAVYDVPRSLVFNAVTQLHAVLSPYVAQLDLLVADPAFEVDQIPTDMIHSVTFRLPEADERARLAAMRRFMDRRDAFERRHIRMALTNLRTRTELQAALRLQAPYVSGYAVCGPISEPIGRLTYDIARLPLKPLA